MFDEPELTLAAAWQLALAMGSTASLDATEDGKLRTCIAVPMGATALRPRTSHPGAASPTTSGEALETSDSDSARGVPAGDGDGNGLAPALTGGGVANPQNQTRE